MKQTLEFAEILISFGSFIDFITFINEARSRVLSICSLQLGRKINSLVYVTEPSLRDRHTDGSSRRRTAAHSSSSCSALLPLPPRGRDRGGGGACRPQGLPASGRRPKTCQSG